MPCALNDDYRRETRHTALDRFIVRPVLNSGSRTDWLGFSAFTCDSQSNFTKKTFISTAAVRLTGIETSFPTAAT